ncbi:MAG: phosphotransferase [Anaerolineae bacterium]|nr:phosphotransferase [Anaerolineae bacterium]
MPLDLNDLAAIGGALQTTFPALGAVAPRRILETGFSSVALETAEGLIFLVARNAAAGERYARIAPLLPALRGHLPLPVPDPQWYAGPCELFRFGVIGYPRLPGKPFEAHFAAAADMRRIASDMGRFLAALHSYPYETLPVALGPVSKAERQAGWEALRANVLPALRGALAPGEYRKIVRWWDGFLADANMHRFAPALRHGDMWYGNFLVDAALRRIVGVVDLENLAPDDPAQDFTTQLYLGARFTRQVIEAYRAAGGAFGADDYHRAQRLWEVREFGGVEYSVQFDDAEEFADSIKKLRSGPILNPGGIRLT